MTWGREFGLNSSRDSRCLSRWAFLNLCEVCPRPLLAAKLWVGNLGLLASVFSSVKWEMIVPTS